VKDFLLAINPALIVPARALKRALFGADKQRAGSLPY
jgi:hypothetical protein